MSKSSSVLKKCWNNILYEHTLLRTGVVDKTHYASLVSRSGPQSGQGTVVLQWLNLATFEVEQGKVKIIMLLYWLGMEGRKDLYSLSFCVIYLYFSNLEEATIFGEQEQTFNGRHMANCEGLPLAGTDFSLYANVKTRQAGCIFCSIPENRMWMNDSKALIIDATGVIQFISGPNVMSEGHSRVNDDKWHEVAVVYSEENKRYITIPSKRKGEWETL